jgi:voltage-gated potassium channel
MPEEFNPQTFEIQRRELLEQIESWLEVPMLVLGFVWLVLLGIEFLWERVWEQNPLFNTLSTAIWIVFIVNFAIELVLAPRKIEYFKRNWLSAISLLVPALRVFRIFRLVGFFRAARVTRGIRLVRMVGSLNRGMRALGASMSRRGFGYIVALTVLVTVSGAAGMYAFENGSPDGLNSFGEALWWTAMIMTTMGSAYWPQSPEGRVLCIILSLYAFGIFGYVTATLATYFVGRDAQAEEGEVAGAKAIGELKNEIVALRADISKLPRDEGRRKSNVRDLG